MKIGKNNLYKTRWKKSDINKDMNNKKRKTKEVTNDEINENVRWNITSLQFQTYIIVYYA